MNRKRQSNNTTGAKGVFFVKNSPHPKKWWAYIWVNKKRYGLGMHKTFEEACQARINALRQYHGEFARID